VFFDITDSFGKKHFASNFNPNMKNTLRISALLLSCTIIFSACSSTTIVKVKNPPPGQVKKAESGKVPPGQAKKATGSKSAKEFAPGQQKKTSKSTKGKTK
jgi:hypothetical protein